MLNKLHETIFDHLKGLNMNKTAEYFLEESKYFPTFQADVKEIPKDVLSRCVGVLKENVHK